MNAVDLFRLDGARALVTGASRGIGKAVAQGLADAGCDLALTARTPAALDDTVRSVQDRGRKAVALDADLAEPGAAADLVDRAAAALGGLDVVVHNAGILPTTEDGAPLLVPLQHARQQDWETVVSVNLNATAALCRAAHPHLADSGRASLVLMSSVAGLVGTPMMEAYAATKAAQLSLTRSLAVGWARQGIRVNALCPGWTRTDMTAFAADTEPLSDWLTSHVPLGRWATADEVVGATLFLASPASSFVTGHALVVDGGLAVPDGGLAGYPKPPSPFAAA
ncbi:putative gluconate 5-dehydrogenase [Streptomyces lincolnensis]|uniref:Putative gluconate 5-dehydrogenase n=1 Tax=Streptomyces lincolnensis TaxID=1915 RepID=A0A1B1M421_STRLN|nr:SDR family NAD(P)-dependent oxidoreductase [Streptomyces lincolnensis]ANS63152.1 putative gluconate 5-dehydrogenase [Streptomyces lincolnensis]AXG52075.1 putative gluconate 5-dehydrogenase [Streptomyces lincolnensis]QMV05058.1 SDR family oxidoreductase [Streptomyces lincolnensis]